MVGTNRIRDCYHAVSFSFYVRQIIRENYTQYYENKNIISYIERRNKNEGRKNGKHCGRE